MFLSECFFVNLIFEIPSNAIFNFILRMIQFLLDVLQTNFTFAFALEIVAPKS
jgi:hypothetical protein